MLISRTRAKLKGAKYATHILCINSVYERMSSKRKRRSKLNQMDAYGNFRFEVLRIGYRRVVLESCADRTD